MPRIALLALALLLTASSGVLAMGGGGGVGAGGGGGFGLPLWQPPGAAYGYYGSPADASGFALHHPVRRTSGHVRAHHHSRYHPQ